MEDICYRMDMNGFLECAEAIDSGTVEQPKDVSDEDWILLKHQAEATVDFGCTVEALRERMGIGYF